MGKQQKYYNVEIITDGNFNPKHGFALPSAIAIKDKEVLGICSGFVKLLYPSAVTAECFALTLGFNMATNYCDRKDEKNQRGYALVENDHRNLVSFLNGTKLKKRNGLTGEIERILEIPKKLKKTYRIDVTHKRIGNGFPHELSKSIEELLMAKAKEY